MQNVHAGQSKIEGRGLFASRSFEKGKRVCIIKGVRKFKINKSVDDALRNPDWIGISKHIWIDPAIPFKFLNHSCDPNTGIRGAVTIYALRDIRKDEEITIDYSTIEGDSRWRLPYTCACKSRKCRSVIKSIHYLPRPVFEKYLPYVPTYFQRTYRRQLRSV